MAYSTIQYGSSGEDVKKLQTELNKHGYNLDVDGQFGSKTQSAVKDYQKKNGLAVDGVVGKNTWGSLTSSASTTKTTTVKPPKTKTERPVYEKSEQVLKAEQKLSDWETNTPDSYNSKYSAEIDSILNEILNREKFHIILMPIRFMSSIRKFIPKTVKRQ